LVRAPPCHGGSCEFESRPVRQKNASAKAGAFFVELRMKLIQDSRPDPLVYFLWN